MKTILIATIIQFILGALWYSPALFGKWWMQIMEATQYSKEELKAMQKQMAPFYVLQFLLTIIYTGALFFFFPYGEMFNWNQYIIAGIIWVGIIMPVQVSGVIWGNTKKKFWFKQIFVMASYQLVSIMIAAAIL